MNKLIILFVLASSFTFSLQSNKPANKLTADKSMAIELAKQLSRLPDVKSCILVKHHHTPEVLSSNMAKHLPVILLATFKYANWPMYSANDLFAIAKVKRDDCLNVASGDKVLVSMEHQDFYKLYKFIAAPNNLPKVLLVSTTWKPLASYKHQFKRLLRLRIINVDVLEISRLKYTIHSYNPFSGVYRKSKFSTINSNNWFQCNKLNNLHAYTLKTSNFDKYYCPREFYRHRKETFRVYFIGSKSLIALYVKQSMNFTLKRLPDDHPSIDLFFTSYLMSVPYDSQHTYLKPIHFKVTRIYTPIAHDKYYDSMRFTEVLFNTATIAWIIVMLHLCKRVGYLDEATWSPLSVLIVLLGLTGQSPRLKGPLQHALLCLMLVTGIFFATQLSNLVTDALVPGELERSFNCFEDLKSNNVTLWLTEAPGKSNNSAIVKSGVNYEVHGDRCAAYQEQMMQRVAGRGDIAITIIFNVYFTEIYGNTVVREGKVVARKSQMIEGMTLTSYKVKNFSPFVEKFSDLYWRFEECGFDLLHKYKYIDQMELGRSVRESLPIDVDDEEEEIDNYINTRDILIIAVICYSLAFIVLLVEILYVQSLTCNF